MTRKLVAVPRLETEMGPPRGLLGAPRARGTLALALGHDRCSTTEKGPLIGSLCGILAFLSPKDGVTIGNLGTNR